VISTRRPPPAQLQSALKRWDACILDPASTPLGREPFAATAYRNGRLIVHCPDRGTDERVRAILNKVLARRNWIADHQRSQVTFRPAASAAAPVDSWAVLAEMRAHQDPEVAAGVGLDHVLTAAEQVGGNPFALGHGRVGMDQYGVGGPGGRGPVSVVLPAPVARRTARRPRIVVLDTGIGDHPWFRSSPAQTTLMLADGTIVGPQIDPASIRGLAADGFGALANPLLGALASHAGHGTFIAGLIRQACPDADIVALAVMGSDGMVAESTLTDALDLLAAKQREQAGWADALVLSLGYYAESDRDLVYNTKLKNVLVALGRLGIAVFCAAGNDASVRPSYPAAFARHPEFADPDVVPLSSVAALNPDGTVALFSNDGPWVTAQALGVNLVSTVPVDVEGSRGSGIRTLDAGGRYRSGQDLDDLGSGFASWSGTSFAAPVLAGKYLRALAKAGFPPIRLRRGLVPTGGPAADNPAG